jgi:hypothetical protein
MWKSIIVAAGIFVGIPAFAETALDKDAAYEMSKDFAKCSAIFDAVSVFIQKHDPNMAENYQGLARGALLASSIVASSVVPDEKAQAFAKNRKDSEAPWWLSTVQHEGINDEVKRELLKCNELNPIQAKLMEEVRKNIYGFK